MGFNWFFPLKSEATGYCMELALGMAILAMADWSIAYIWQPNDSFVLQI